VPLVRSDYLFEPTGQQCHTCGLASWLPFHGTGTLIGKSAIGQSTSEQLDSYDFRSHMAGSVTACWDVRRKDLDYDELRRLTAQLRESAPYFVLGDFYPLTPYSLGADTWMAWQYDRPEQGNGIVQAFRREGNSESKKSFQLRGLDGNAKYQVTVADNTGDPVVQDAGIAGSTLTIEMPKPRSAALIFYRKRADAK
jgi:alpha-galactosidase